MYCKFVPTLAILSSLLIPVLSLAVPPRAELERYASHRRGWSGSDPSPIRRELAAGSVENLEAREPWGAAIKGISRVARGAHRAYKVRQRVSPKFPHHPYDPFSNIFVQKGFKLVWKLQSTCQREPFSDGAHPSCLVCRFLWICG